MTHDDVVTAGDRFHVGVGHPGRGQEADTGDDGSNDDQGGGVFNHGYAENTNGQYRHE